ncbi:MAG: hypothetical protein JW832_06830 [Deltaproteobacteria bacterium]|nr:hypothetical protein [Deltaproteobacteria bacterium]
MASAKEIPPGGEGKINVTLKTGSGSGGKREKHISVMTNDPDNKRISLAIKTTVIELLGVSPSRINFYRVKKGTEQVRYASLSGEEKDAAKLTGFDSSNPSIRVDLNPQGYEGNKYQQIKITLLPTMRAGRFFDRVTLHTDHKKIKDIRLNLIGEVIGDIALMPSQLHFGLFRPGKPIDRVIKLRAAEGVTFKILGVTSTLADVTARVETVTPGAEYLIRAQLKDTFEGSSLSGKLIITTDLKKDSTLEVRILGRKLPPLPAGQAGAATAPAQSALQGRPQQAPAEKGFITFPPPPPGAQEPK